MERIIYFLRTRKNPVLDFLYKTVLRIQLRLKYGYLGSCQTRWVINRFHKIYYDSGSTGKTWKDTLWLGVKVLKNPFDLWIYQEIIFKIKPDIIIETGTAFGGSTLYLASLCDLLHRGRIYSVDILKLKRPKHPRIVYLQGSSTDGKILNFLKGKIGKSDRVMVILDSDHRCDHVLSELKSYAPFVTKNSYLIVEDGNLNGHPVAEGYGPGPFEAIQNFLRENNLFVVDKSREKFLITFNPDGYLKKSPNKLLL